MYVIRNDKGQYLIEEHKKFLWGERSFEAYKMSKEEAQKIKDMISFKVQIIKV